MQDFYGQKFFKTFEVLCLAENAFDEILVNIMFYQDVFRLHLFAIVN